MRVHEGFEGEGRVKGWRLFSREDLYVLPFLRDFDNVLVTVEAVFLPDKAPCM